jgi:hypothetical protein
MVTVNRDFQKLRTRGVAEANAIVGRVRTAHITPIPGQEWIYQQKEEEARAYLAGDHSRSFEFLYAEARGDVTGTAYRILNRASEVRVALATLETHRMNALEAIAAATTQPQIDAALSTLSSAVEHLEP